MWEVQPIAPPAKVSSCEKVLHRIPHSLNCYKSQDSQCYLCSRCKVSILIKGAYSKLLNRKPKNARSKRELAKREPQQVENPKNALFLRFTNTSSLLTSLMRDIQVLKRPYAVPFQKGNNIHPFEDASSLEFFSQKNDTSQILFASHSKKRPHTLTWIRCFGGHILDMIELCVVQETARLISQFKNEKVRPGVKAMLAFSGTAWEDPSRSEYALAKSIFTDFFRGAEVTEMDVEGLQLLISFSVAEEDQNGFNPQIQMRCYKIITKKSGSKVPKIEVDEIGPRIDFRVGRTREGDAGMMKEAMRKAKGTEVGHPSRHLIVPVVLTSVYRPKRRRTSRQISWVTRWVGYILGGKT